MPKNPQVRVSRDDEERMHRIGERFRQTAYHRELIAAMLARHDDETIYGWVAEDRGKMKEED